MNSSEFSRVGVWGLPERRSRGGGKQLPGLFSRIFLFPAALALCLSVLTVFPQNASAAPTSLQAQRNGDEITLTWSEDNSPVYMLYVYEGKGGASLSHDITDLSATSLTVQISSLLSGMNSVRFKVRGMYPPTYLFSESNWTDFISLSRCSSQSGTDLQSDCAALETLYNSTGGANWADRTNWNTSSPLGDWHGITVRDGRVAEIELYNNNLTGTISDLSDLTGLVELDLGNDPRFAHLGTNSLSGTIPATLNALTNLNDLLLDGNSLSGTIPDLSATELRILRLNDNNIGGSIPTWLNDMDPNIRELALYNNKLTGAIPDLSDIGGSKLDLSNNLLGGSLPQATYFPTGLTQEQENPGRRSGGASAAGLPDTGKLDLSNNRLTGSLDNLSSLAGVHYMDFSNNQFGGTINAGHIPPNVSRLDLQNNRLSGSIPDLTSLTKLAELFLQNNRFSGTIPDLSATATREVWLNGNSISGTIDANDFNTGIYWLYLHDNNLSGSADLSSLTSLIEISLWGNPNLDISNITGVAQKAIEKAALVMLYYDTGGDGWNSNSGWLYGHNFGAWNGVTADGSGNVTGLDLSGNSLRGNIGSGLTGLKSLATLDLSDNASLSGTFPVMLKNSSITSVDIRCTGITVPTNDADFTTWKNGLGSSFQSGCVGGGGSQGSSPPVSQPLTESPVEEGEGQGEGEQESIQSLDPVPASPAPDAGGSDPAPASDPGGIEAQGGCALVSGAGEEHPGTAVLGLFLAASVLFAVLRRGGCRGNGCG